MSASGDAGKKNRYVFSSYWSSPSPLRSPDYTRAKRRGSNNANHTQGSAFSRHRLEPVSLAPLYGPQDYVAPSAASLNKATSHQPPPNSMHSASAYAPDNNPSFLTDSNDNVVSKRVGDGSTGYPLRRPSGWQRDRAAIAPRTLKGLEVCAKSIEDLFSV